LLRQGFETLFLLKKWAEFEADNRREDQIWHVLDDQTFMCFFLRWLSDFPFKTRCAFFLLAIIWFFPTLVNQEMKPDKNNEKKKTILVIIKNGSLENPQFTFISMISDAIPSYKPADNLLLTATSLPKLWPSRYQDSSGWLRMRRPKLSLGKLPATFSAPIDPAAGIKGRLPTQQLSWT